MTTEDEHAVTLLISNSARDAMISHAREGAPEEVCGILAGEAQEEEPDHLLTTHRTTNVAACPETTYAVDPEEQLATMDAVEAEGRDVVGFYHTHPQGPDGPSATDRARATWPGYVYVVVSLAGEEPSVGAWRWTGDEFEREEMRVV